MMGARQSALPPLHFRGMVLGPSGFAAQGREWLRLLEDLGLNPSLHGARLGPVEGGETPAERALIARCAARPKQRDGITVQHVLPPHFEPDGDARANIVMTVFETTSLPEGWGHHLNQADAVIVPAQPIADAFVRGGVSFDRVRAIAPPVNTAPYVRGVKAWQGMPPRRPGVTRLLSVVDWSLRKGMDVLLPAVARACTADEADLVLKLAPRPDQDRDALQRQCQMVVRQHSHGEPVIVHVLDPLVEAEEMPSIYASCDALVLPSRGEGWGRPVHEAMLMGLPVVATQAGALATLLPDATVGFPVASSIEQVLEEAAIEAPVFRGQQWWQPDFDDLVSQIRCVVRNPIDARARGLRAQSHIRSLCDPAAIASTFCGLLDEVVARQQAPICAFD